MDTTAAPQQAGFGVEQPIGLGAAQPTAGWVSDVVVDALRALGVRYVPLNPGSSFRGLHDSLVNHAGNRGPQLLLCHHEEIAVAVAHGHAKATGGVAVAAVHDLVGLMHASMAVYDAWCDRQPVLLLGGGGPADPAARRPIDWAHSASAQTELVRPFCKWTAEPMGAQASVDDVVRGFALAATAPRAPVYVTLDAGVLEQPLADGIAVPDLARVPAPAPPAAPAEAVEAAAAALLAAERPVVVTGRPAYDPATTAPLVRLVELLGAGHVDARNHVALPTDHPANLNGDRAAIRDADVVLALDAPDLHQSLGRRSTRDRDTERTATAGRRTVIVAGLEVLFPSSWSGAGQAPVPVDLALAGDAVTVLRQLVAAVEDRVAAAPAADAAARDQRREAVAARHRELRAAQEAALAARWDDELIAPQRLAAELGRVVGGQDPLLVLRNTRTWPEGAWSLPGAGSYLGHSGGGGVGYGPGAAVGGALAARDAGRPAVGIIGDGDLLMAPGALWTAVHYGVPLLLVVNDNRSFYNDEEHQREVARHRGRPEVNGWIGMRLDDPAVDLATLARSYGCWAEGPVSDRHQLRAVLQRGARAAAEGAVAVVDVVTAST